MNDQTALHDKIDTLIHWCYRNFGKFQKLGVTGGLEAARLLDQAEHRQGDLEEILSSLRALKAALRRL
jgi:hypothetical protein